MQEQLALDIESCGSEPQATIVHRKPHERDRVAFRAPGERELYPCHVSDLLPASHVAHGIRSVLSELDLSKFRDMYADNGGAPYDPRPMLGILLLGCVLGETGSENLAQHCQYDVRYMVVSLCQTPNARTIRRFRRRVGMGLVDVFMQVVSLCDHADLVRMRRVALDGTKMLSAASQLKNWLTRSEKEDISSMGLEVPETSDPDARIMKRRKGYVLGYNAQAVVDCDSGVVVAVDITDNSSDYPSLEAMASKIIEMTGRKPDELVADAGYDSNEGICACAKLEIDTVVAIQNDSPDFWTVTQEGEILCPMGNMAVRLESTTQCRGKECQKFLVQGCVSCIFRESCIGPNSNGRCLQLPVGCDPAERLNAAHLARTPDGRQALIERMSTIERVFADIAWNKGLRRFRLRSKPGALIEWLLIHIARNIQILHKARMGYLGLYFWLKSRLARLRKRKSQRQPSSWLLPASQ